MRSLFVNLVICLLASASSASAQQEIIQKDKKKLLVKDKLAHLSRDKILQNAEAAKLKMKEALQGLRTMDDERVHAKQVVDKKEEQDVGNNNHRRNQEVRRATQDLKLVKDEDAEKRINREILDKLARLGGQR